VPSGPGEFKIIQEKTIDSDSYIVNITKPVLVTPTNVGSSGTSVVFVWEIPTNSASKNIHSYIEIDTVDTFDSVNLVTKKSYQDSGFEYDNGGFIAYPSTGVTSTYYDEQARFTVTLASGTWYWRVRGEITS